MFKFLSAVALCAGLPFAIAGPLPNNDNWGAPAPYFYKGHDLSSLTILENGGAIYHDTARHNQTRPVEDILGDGGMNTVRLRLWVTPCDYPGGIYCGQYDLPYTLNLAQRFSKKGYKIYLDFHFSDWWADPQHNQAPFAWPTDLNGLTSTLRSYVSNTLNTFSKAGVDLALVSLGNEIRHGMLWPLGQVDVDIFPESARVANFTNLAHIYKAARQGVDDAVSRHGCKKPGVMIHIDNGWNLTLQQTWFSALTGSGIVSRDDWDIFGFSFYPFYGNQATLANLQNSLNTLAVQYRKPLHVVETDWPAICNPSEGVTVPELSEPEIPVSAAGQIEWERDIINVVKQVPYGLGQGVDYWEPAWLNLTSLGSNCTDAILFDTDWSQYPKMLGYSRSSVNMFQT